jgi:hypothetical protein
MVAFFSDAGHTASVIFLAERVFGAGRFEGDVDGRTAKDNGAFGDEGTSSLFGALGQNGQDGSGFSMSEVKNNCAVHGELEKSEGGTFQGLYIFCKD